MKDEPRISAQGLRLLKTFLENPDREFSGAELMKIIGISSGTMYPVLIRYEECGLLESRWEIEDPTDLKRPRKRLYTITAAGREKAREALTGFAVPDALLNPAR